MPIAARFDELVEAADSLTVEEQEALVDILKHRLTDARRQELAGYIREARHEYQSGHTQVSDVADIMDDILS